MQGHPFVRAIEADALPPDALRRYLIIECGFVDAAIAIFGYALIKAPDLATRRELVTILRGLTEDQMPFFEQAFAELGVAGEPWREPAPPAAGMLREGMLGFAAHGGFAEVMTAMLAAEWTYREFCGRALERPISDPYFAAGSSSMSHRPSTGRSHGFGTPSTISGWNARRKSGRV